MGAEEIYMSNEIGVKAYLGFTDGQIIPNRHEKYIWISSRCTEGTAWCRKNNKKYEVMHGFFNDSETVKQAVRYLKKTRQKVVETAVRLLNSYHDVSYKQHEWNYLIGYWINIYLFTLYEKYLELKDYQKNFDSAECKIVNPDTIEPCLDFAEYIESAEVSDNFHLKLYSELVMLMNMDKKLKIMEQGVYIREKFDFSNHVKSKYKAKLYKKCLYIFKLMMRKKDKVVMWHCYFPKNYTLKLMRMGKGRITDYITNWYLLDRPYLSEVVDRSWRKTGFPLPDGLDEFEKIACRLLKKHFPTTFVENFNYLMQRVQKDYKYAMEPNAILFSCVEGQTDEVFKVYLMQMKQKRVKMCDVQHGGNYGIDYLWSSHMEYDSCDIFYTWGWKLNGKYHCQFKPMPAAKMFNGILGNVRKGDRILYINYLYSKYPIEPSLRTEKHLQNQKAEIKFFASLSNHVKQQVRVRLYPRDYGWDFAKRLKKAVPDLMYDDTSDYYESLNQAKLVVLSDWSTTILEALSADKPILVFRNCEIEDEAYRDIMELKDAGILSDNWNDLREKLEEISKDVDKWWHDSIRQQAIQRIKEKYIYLPEVSEQIWNREISRLAGR